MVYIQIKLIWVRVAMHHRRSLGVPTSLKIWGEEWDSNPQFNRATTYRLLPICLSPHETSYYFFTYDKLLPWYPWPGLVLSNNPSWDRHSDRYSDWLAYHKLVAKVRVELTTTPPQTEGLTPSLLRDNCFWWHHSDSNPVLRRERAVSYSHRRWCHNWWW